MARINIPIDVLTSRLNFGERFSGLRSQTIGQRFANIKPVSEFFDLKRVSKPANFNEVQTRVNYNLAYFSSNYAVLFVMLSIYSLITNPWLLFDIIFVSFGMWFIGKLQGNDLELGTFKATTSQLYTGLLCIAVPIGFFASPIATILWLIGASGVTILGHAALMERPIENAFSEEASWSEYDDRFEELETDDDGLHGVGLDQGYGQKRYASDELRFTGIDLGGGSAALRRRPGYYDEEYSPSDEEGYEVSTGLVRRDQGQLMLRDKEEALVERALERIRRARALGKTNVKLSRAEIDALERLERGQNPPPTPPIPMPAPKQAPKGKKAPQPKPKAIEAKKGAKSSKSAGNSPKPKSKEPRSRGQSVASNRSKGSAKDEALVPYPLSPDEQYAYPPWYGRPGGPNSLQQEARAGSSRGGQRESMPPYPYYTHAYNSHPDVIYGPRPGSNSSRASRPDPADPDWEPRTRSASSLVNYPVDQLPQQAVAGTRRAPRFDPSDPRYGSPPTRRVVSGPPRGRQDELFLPDDQSDALQYLTESTTNDEGRSTSDSDDSGQGVQVDVEDRGAGSYAIQTRAAAQKRANGGKGAGKKRR